MKKTLCLIAILAMTAITGYAADKTKAEPDVIVDGSKILFNDQNAVIVDGVTLVPARGVFEAMGNTVKWVEESRMVIITTSTGVRYVRVYIDSDIMKVNQYKTLMEETSEEIKLEVPAQIMNDRTMIPLRAVSEAFDGEVEWNEDDYVINITTTEPPLLEGYEHKPKTPIEEMVTMSLSTDAKDIKAGDEFDVFIEIKNIPENSYVTAISAMFEFDKTKLEYIENSGSFLNDNEETFVVSTFAENTKHESGTKISFITSNQASARKTDGKCFKATFKALVDIPAEIELTNDYRLGTGYASYFIFASIDTEKNQLRIVPYDGKNIHIDKTPLVIE